MIPLEELFARLESSAEEVAPHGLIPRPQKQRGLGMRLVVIETFVHSGVCTFTCELASNPGFPFWISSHSFAKAASQNLEWKAWVQG